MNGCWMLDVKNESKIKRITFARWRNKKIHREVDVGGPKFNAEAITNSLSKDIHSPC